MANAVIQIQHLYKVYRVGTERVVALSDINLEVPRGQVCCIVGTSGSGKSTLLNQLAGLEKPTKGRVLIGGKNISAFSENQLARFRQRNIGFIFQSYNLIPTMTALENVSMPLIFRGVSRSKRDRAARRILAEVGLTGRLRHRPSQMSGGQQQRVGIARAFVATPKIIFADEPTGNLDTRTTVEVMRMMVRLAHENDQTLVIVTHDNEIAEYADRVVTLRDGEIIDDRTRAARGERPPQADADAGLESTEIDDPEQVEGPVRGGSDSGAQDETGLPPEDGDGGLRFEANGENTPDQQPEEEEGSWQTQTGEIKKEGNGKGATQ